MFGEFDRSGRDWRSSAAVGQESSTAARSWPAVAMFLYDSRRCSERLIGFTRTRKSGGDIGFQNYNSASRGVPGCKLIRRGTLEAILRQNLVAIDSTGCNALTGLLLHNLVSLGAWPVGR
jgi:hypothetical protein